MVSWPFRIPALLAGLTLAACAPPPEPRGVELKISHIAQEQLLCVPTSAAMILGYYGDPQSPRRLKALAAGRVYDPNVPFDDFSITLFRDQIRAVRDLGYHWREETFADTPEGLAEGMKRVEAELSAGRPVMVDVTLQAGHTFVVAGFDPVQRRLIIVDPAAPAPGRHVVSYEEFGRIWNERAYGGDFRAMILTAPKSES